MRLIGEANRLRLFNKTLGTNALDLSAYPVDFVETVIAWGAELKE